MGITRSRWRLKDMNRQFSPNRASSALGLHGRTLYVVDVENMVGSCELTVPEVVAVQARIYAVVRPESGAHAVIAASHHNATAAYFGWAGPAQRLVRSGKDGADIVLLEAIADTAWIVGHYGQVVIASGDHIFANAVAALKAAGVRVIVIAPETGLSSRMRLAAGPNLVSLRTTISPSVKSLTFKKKDAA